MIGKVFLTRMLPKEAMEYLAKHCDVSVNERDMKLSEEEIIKHVENKDGLICLLNDKITRKVLESSSKLKIVSNFGVGYNNIDVKVATELGIMVTNTPKVLDDTTAELAFALMIAVTRRLLEGDRFVRSGKWVTGWEINLFQGFDLHHKTLGIIGMGNIGQSLAKKAHAFDMKIIYHNRNRLDNSIENLYDAKYTSLEVLLSESDIISLHTPLSPETHHLIDEKEIELMKDTAIIINTARGEVINEKSLYEALRVKRIWGAGLDVFENEPILTPGLVDLENVILLPHIGSASVETRNRMSMMVVNNVIAGISGNIPNNLVNKGVLGDWK